MSTSVLENKEITIDANTAAKVKRLVVEYQRIQGLDLGNWQKAADQAAIINQIGKLIGLPITTNEGNWNKVIRWLDDNHQGWRGYSVHFRDGRVG